MHLFGWGKSKDPGKEGLIEPISDRPTKRISRKDIESFFESHLLEKPLTDSAEWSKPKIPFLKMVDAYETVVRISFGIDFLAEAT